MNDYIIGTGFHARENRGQLWFWRLWLDNTRRYSNPREVIVMASGGVYPDLLPDEPASNWFYLSGDLGHCGMLLHGEKSHHFSGGSTVINTLAMLCYMNEADFIYKEQDTLAFGPWVEQMYAEIGSHGCIFGNCPGVMPSAQALMLVKHEFIPEMVRLYLGTGRENVAENMGECKFSRLQKQHPDLFCRYGFGYDRARPFNVNDPVWHAQKFTSDELRSIAAAGLIPAESIVKMPTVTHPFSNA